MEAFWHISFFSAWIYFSLFQSFCLEPRMMLENTVFVALSDKPLHINLTWNLPQNESSSNLTCYDPSKIVIYKCEFHPQNSKPLSLELKNLNSSGEYYCEYKSDKAYWFLQVREKGYQKPAVMDATLFTVLWILSGLLLVFSVVGSVYVVRRHWLPWQLAPTQTAERMNQIMPNGTKDTKNKRSKNEKQKMVSKKRKDMTDDNDVHAVTSSAASFYASLETRPRSIYDVLDHEAANKGPEQHKAQPKKKTPHKEMVQTTQPQEEEVFERVYENF